MADPARSRPGGKDAVCFTAGLRGAAFGAGVIHAWLASDREPPVAAAGVSVGALSAAAMQKAYRELESPAPSGQPAPPPEQAGADLERRRWSWYRRYLDAVTNQPLRFLWNAIPDPVDFSAEKPPVNDLAAPPEAGDQAEARRHFHLLTKLGVWTAGLPVRVSTLAGIAVHYVRWKERYGWWRLSRLLCWASVARAAVGAWWRLVWAPGFFLESSFGRRGFRPLFGWPVWLLGIAPLVALPLAAVTGTLAGSWWVALAAFIVLPLLPLALALPFLGRLGAGVSSQIDIKRGLFSQFELRRVLFDLFGDGHPDPALTPDGARQMRLMLVCAALQQTKQVWPTPAVDLVTGISAAMCVAGAFPPVPIAKDHLECYSASVSPAEVIDGVAVRSNPIPAFFDWCCLPQNREIARSIESQPGEPPTLHVVYSVPTGAEVTAAPPGEAIDIVDSATVSLALEKRRDTRQEVRQTNFLSRLEAVRRRATGQGWTPQGCFSIFADEIAPASELAYRNQWEPSRAEGLAAAAQGCANALETLYRAEIHTLSKAGRVPCSALLRVIAPRRAAFANGDACGLPEICGQCPRVLAYRPADHGELTPPGVIRSFGEPGPSPAVALDRVFPHLSGDEPRIVFLGSGGVFRGAFHIGAIAAMHAAGIQPDLVVGASVGALMGGALAAISVAAPPEKKRLLSDLALTFLEVDKRVALTGSLKNAAKQLGIRARAIDVSPAELRAMVRGGSRGDAGFAATGAPPALIDAISNLFMIPHRRTAAIASSFVAGHITEAVHRFLIEIRRETLSSFDIRTALMGASLLEPQARRLLGDGVADIRLDRVQPYHCAAKKVSFFCTTSFLNARISLLLGRDFLTEDPTWDFVSATLSSAAFPAVFSPRSEAQALPGRGRTDRLFADGGMFDNLPFFPAIEIMGAAQACGRSLNPADVIARLQSRTTRRDIIIAAGLDAEPEQPLPEYDTLGRIRARAKSLSVDSKVETFVNAAEKTQRILAEIAATGGGAMTPEDLQAADGAVTAAILKILPADKEHINPTFAFCRSAGMNRETVSRSISHGCFRSLAAFVDAQTNPDTSATFQRRFAAGGQGPLQRGSSTPGPRHCPYFSFANGPLACPFDQDGMADPVRAIRSTCAADKVHIAATR
jgi:predicted acylesterase/phospholipase RssA